MKGDDDPMKRFSLLPRQTSPQMLCFNLVPPATNDLIDTVVCCEHACARPLDKPCAAMCMYVDTDHRPGHVLFYLLIHP